MAPIEVDHRVGAVTGAHRHTPSVHRERCKNNEATGVVYLFFAARACCAAAFIVYFPVAIWVRLHPTSTVPGLGLPISWLAFWVVALSWVSALPLLWPLAAFLLSWGMSVSYLLLAAPWCWVGCTPQPADGLLRQEQCL